MGIWACNIIRCGFFFFSPVRRERQEDDREIIYQVHSRREARHQDRQIRGQDTGELLAFNWAFWCCGNWDDPAALLGPADEAGGRMHHGCPGPLMWTSGALLMAAEVALLFELRLKHSFGAAEFLLQLPCSTASSECEPYSAASAAPPRWRTAGGGGG